MKTILRVTNDYESTTAYDMYKEDLEQLIYGLNIHVENESKQMNNILPGAEKTRFPNDYNQAITIECRGYSQGDWDRYNIHYNQGNQEVAEKLAKELKNLFTHKHDYKVREFEVLETGHELQKDTHWIYINHIEFPEKLNVLEAIEGQGIEYDDIEFNIN